MTKETKHKLDKWINKNYKWFKYQVGKNITWGRMSEYTDDLIHHVILDLYKVKDEQIEDMLETGKIKGWVLRAASLQIKSKTSPFYKTFRKFKMSARSGVLEGNESIGYIMDVEEEEQLNECLDRAVSQLHWYQQTIFNKKFKEGLTLDEIYNYYNISKTHLVKDLNVIIAEIRETCKHIN